MQEPEQPISLGLNARPVESLTPSQILPPTESLQFRKAERAPDPGIGPQCQSCKQPTGPSFFQLNGLTVCAACAAAIEAGQKTAPTGQLLKGLFYGLGAAVTGTILYATILANGFELALISILIGYMVGQSIRRGSGSGGRPQQIMAVVLTYLSFSSSYVVVAAYQLTRHRPAQTATARAGESGTVERSPQAARTPGSLADTFMRLGSLAIAAPFMARGAGLGGLLTLAIIFFGLQRAWQLTGRPNLVISGPYQASAPA